MNIKKSKWREEQERLCVIAQLYCEIWKEPPWNEYFWTPEGVIEDIHNQLLEPNAILLCAELNRKIIGFTWGYEVDAKKLKEISGISRWGFLFRKKKDGSRKRVFYIDELGVSREWRERGVGRKLTQKLIDRASSLGIDYITLRTDKEAIAARTLYKKVGFRETEIADAQHPERIYWVRELKK